LEAEISSLKSQISKLQKRLELLTSTQSLAETAKKAESDAAYSSLLKLREQTSGSQVLSPANGRISDIYYTIPGEQITAGSPVADIVINEDGYTLEFTLSAAEAARIKVGDVAKLSGYYYYGNIEIKVSGILTDSSSGGRNKKIVCSVTGDGLVDGSQFSFTFGSISQYYNIVVPASSVHEDNEGSFVYVIEKKQTPFGSRYRLVRRNVTVDVTDGTRTAVVGDINYGEFILTASTKPVEAGDYVRLADN
jgi:multidrug efflux pump subunit AcrA (membrane-fusion protein)